MSDDEALPVGRRIGVPDKDAGSVVCSAHE
jgi:hypothetical protein